MYTAARAYSLPFILLAFSFVLFFDSINTSGQSLKAVSPEALELNRQAVLLFGEKRFSDAIGLLEKAVKLEPSFAEAHLNIGSAYLLSNQPETALTYLKRGVELDPNSYKGFNQLGVDYNKLGKTDLALDNLKKAVELKPDFALGHFNLGFVYIWANRIKPSVAELETASKLDPVNLDIRLYLGVAYARQSRYTEAIQEVKRLTKQRPDDEEANLVLCRIYLMANDRQAALDMYQAFKTVNLPLADEMFKSIFSGKVLYVEKD